MNPQRNRSTQPSAVYLLGLRTTTCNGCDMRPPVDFHESRVSGQLPTVPCGTSLGVLASCLSFFPRRTFFELRPFRPPRQVLFLTGPPRLQLLVDRILGDAVRRAAARRFLQRPPQE